MQALFLAARLPAARAGLDLAPVAPAGTLTDPCIEGAFADPNASALMPHALPQDCHIDDGLIVRLPAGEIEAVLANLGASEVSPQPLPQEAGFVGTPFAVDPHSGALPGSLPGPLQTLGGFATPFGDAFARIPTQTDGAITSLADREPETAVQRSDPKQDIAQPADQIGSGSFERERQTLKNVLDDDIAHGTRRPERERVKPFGPDDYIGGIGNRQREGDRMRPPLFVKAASDANEVSINDVKQQMLNDCYFMSALAAVAMQDPQRIKDMIVDNGDGTYTVTFKERALSFEGPKFVDRKITVTADFPGGVSGNGHAGGADLTKQGTTEIWPLVMEKAFGQFLNATDPYGRLNLEDNPIVALEAITGRPVTKAFFNGGVFGSPVYGFDQMQNDLWAGKAMVIFSGEEATDLVGNHFYTVERMYRDANGKEWVQLYNPWGKDHLAIPFDQVKPREVYMA